MCCNNLEASHTQSLPPPPSPHAPLPTPTPNHHQFHGDTQSDVSAHIIMHTGSIHKRLKTRLIFNGTRQNIRTFFSGGGGVGGEPLFPSNRLMDKQWWRDKTNVHIFCFSYGCWSVSPFPVFGFCFRTLAVDLKERKKKRQNITLALVVCVWHCVCVCVWWIFFSVMFMMLPWVRWKYNCIGQHSSSYSVIK